MEAAGAQQGLYGPFWLEFNVLDSFDRLLEYYGSFGFGDGAVRAPFREQHGRVLHHHRVTELRVQQTSGERRGLVRQARDAARRQRALLRLNRYAALPLVMRRFIRITRSLNSAVAHDLGDGEHGPERVNDAADRGHREAEAVRAGKRADAHR